MNNLQSIWQKLNNGGTFACKKLEQGFTGVIVTKHNVIPARYRAMKFYWLDRVEQNALFVPLHLLSFSFSDVTSRVPVVIRVDIPGGESRLCGGLNELLICAQAKRSLRIEGDISPSALGISVVRYNNRFYAQELYSTVTKPGWHGNEIRLSHQHYQKETKMQDLTALLFGDELYAVTFQDNNVRRYTYKSLKEIHVGTKVVVDTPSNGFQVVTVVACKKGLDKQAQFEQYKWLVGVVDETEYRRLNDAEKDFIRKAKEEQAKREAILKLQALGVTADEYRAAVLGV